MACSKLQRMTKLISSFEIGMSDSKSRKEPKDTEVYQEETGLQILSYRDY